jgi:hypothetical protein
MINVSAPADDNCVRPPTLLSVEVDEGEAIGWIWTHFADGHSAVTGYRLVPLLPALIREVNP